ncbi:MAG TPA: hypothetical protein VK993_00540, partial [Chthoniobacterales bacterium]|nr:hypothetical protein [Chthoniobacterales bacterium]
GDYTLFKLLSGPLGFFESEERVPPQFVNISEASNFYPLWMLGLVGMFAARHRKALPIPALVIGLAVLIVAISLYCTVELPQWLLGATLFAQVHEARALLALGIANILLVCVFLDRYREPVFGLLFGSAGAVIVGAAVAMLFYVAYRLQPTFFADAQWTALVVGVNAVTIAMFFWDRARRWFPVAFVALLVWSNGLINPIMRGLAALTESAAYREIDSARSADSEAKWIAYGDHVTGQLIKATGATVLNGTKVVPDLEFLRALDPSGAFEQVYNRYAWIICTPKVFPEEVSFELLQMEFYTIELPPGLKLLRDQGFNYYVFGSEWRDAMFYDFRLTAGTAGHRLWIYRRDR